MNILFQENGCREILLNSINHKCYEGNIPIQISVYDDKIFIWNDAIFPEELMDKNLYEKHHSRPYNPLIAQTFFKAGFIESWGRGFEKIKEECEKSNVPLPNIEINKNGVMIKCTPSKTYLQVLESMRGKNELSNAQTSPKHRPNIAQTKNIENQILKLIRENNKITQVQMAETLNVSRDIIKRNIKKLKDSNKLKREGNRNNGYWKIL